MGLVQWLRDLFEDEPPAEAPATTPLQEAAPGGYDPDLNLSAEQGGSRFYRRLSRAERDLPEIEHTKQLRLAYWLYDRNPLAKRIAEMIRDYVLGEGMRIAVQGSQTDKARQDRQAIIDRHWSDRENRLDLRLHEWVLNQSLTGELCLSAWTNPKDGFVRWGWIDSEAIKTVITDARNAARVLAVDVQRSDSALEVDRYRVIQVDERPGSPTYGRLVGVETDAEGNVTSTYQNLDSKGQPIGEAKLLAGACLFYRINTPAPTATRGRSDLLAIIDFLDAYDHLLFSEVDRVELLKSFIYHVSLQGANDSDVKRRAGELAKSPKPASVIVTNDKETWIEVTPDLKAQDMQVGLDTQLSHISTGAGLPKTWLNGLMDVNRATASELGEPAFKRLSSRQRIVRYIVEDIGRFVLDQAELARALPRRKNIRGTQRPEPWPLEVQVPEMTSRDQTAVAASLNQVTAALVNARAERLIDQESAQDILVNLASLLGVEIDLDEMRKRLEAEEAQAAERTAQLVPMLSPQPDQPPDGIQPAGATVGANGRG